jgi:hypothetical protein
MEEIQAMYFVNGYGRKGEGYPKINLDLVAELRPNLESGKLDGFDCYDVHGECVGSVDAGDIPDFYSTIIPDSTGSFVLEWVDHGDGTDSIARYPVVAWRIDHAGYSAEPIIHESLPDVWCLELRTGLYVFPEDCFMETLEHATQELKRRENARSKPKTSVK